MNTPVPEAHAFLQFWIIIGFIAVVLSNIGLAVSFMLNRKQKREVTFTETPASKNEFDQFTATTNQNFVQIRDEMKADRSNNEKHASMRSQTLFNQIEKVRSELSGHTEAVRRELSQEIRDVPERVISTLKNTGAI